MKGKTLAAITVWMAAFSPAALGAGTPNSTLAALPANTALDLGALTLTGPEGWVYNPRGVTDYSGFTYDPHTHQMLMFGGGHATSHTDTVYAFKFDSLTWEALYVPTPERLMVCSNYNSAYCAWNSGPSGPYPRPLARHTYDLLVVPASRDVLLIFRKGTASSSEVTNSDLCGNAYVGAPYVPAYDVANNTWQFIPDQENYGYGTAEYDPVSDKVILVNRYGLWVHDPATGTSRKYLSYAKDAVGYANNLVYFPPNQKMYYIARGSRNRVWEVTLDRADWSHSTVVEVTGIVGMPPDSGESGWAYDSVNQVIGGGIKNGVFYAFDPLHKRWLSSTMTVQSPGGHTVGTMTFHCIDFDPVDGVFIFIADGSGGRRTWAYRYVAPPPDPTPPTVPANLQATAVSQSRIDLTWDASSDPESGVAYYKVYRNGLEIAQPVATAYSDTGLQESARYTYEVSAVNGQGLESGRSAPASATTFGPPVPGDADGDGKVDLRDLLIVVNSFGLSEGQIGFDPRADLSGDGTVDMWDVLVVVYCFGTTRA